MNIHADIVFGDPWGIEECDPVNGDSVVIVRNSVGQRLVNDLLHDNRARLSRIRYEELLRGQQIESRKARACETYEVYRALGFQTPPYFEALRRPVSRPEFDRSHKRIQEFLELERMAKHQALKTVSRKVNMELQKQRVRDAIGKIPLVRTLNRLW